MPNSEVVIPPALRKSVTKLTSELKPVIKNVQTLLQEQLNLLNEKIEKLDDSLSRKTIPEGKIAQVPSPTEIEELIEEFHRMTKVCTEYLKNSFKKSNKTFNKEIKKLLGE